MANSDDNGAGDAGQGRPSSHYTGTPDPQELAGRLSDLARSLQDEHSVEDTLDGIVKAAVGTVPGVEHAGLSVVERGRAVHTRAGSDEVVYQVDRVQYETGEGPCLSAMYEQQTVRMPDTTTETRWPQFTHRTIALGIRSMLSFQLYVVGDTLGALNLYSRRTNAFSDESEQVGLLFAAHAAVAMAGAQREHQLLRAMATRDLVGQAKGILMERHKLTGAQAFSVLVRYSQHSNTKLHEVAQHLVDSGELVTRRR